MPNAQRPRGARPQLSAPLVNPCNHSFVERPFSCDGLGRHHMIEILETRIAPAVALAGIGQLAGAFGSNELITTDAAGNIFVVGTFTGTVDFDLGPGVANRDAG